MQNLIHNLPFARGKFCFAKDVSTKGRFLTWLKSLLPPANSYLDLQVIKMYFYLLIVNRILNSMQKTVLTSWRNLHFAQGKLDIRLTDTKCDTKFVLQNMFL